MRGGSEYQAQVLLPDVQTLPLLSYSKLLKDTIILILQTKKLRLGSVQ